MPEGRVVLEVTSSDVEVDRWGPRDVWIAGRVQAPGQHLKPGLYSGPCTVERPDDRTGGPAAVVSCPFARGEKAALAIRLGGLLPWTALSMTVPEEARVEVVEPARGAVVSGRLSDASEQLLLLAPSDGSLPVRAWTDADGGFLIEGLAVGEYWLSLAPSGLDQWPVRVASLADRLELGDLHSSVANRMTLRIGTSAPEIAEDLVITAVALTLNQFGEIDRRGSRTEASRTDDGAWLWEGLPVGDYELRVDDSRGNRWHEELVQFHGHDDFLVELDLVPVEGVLRRAGEGVPQTLLWFGGVWGAERVAMRSGSGGEFRGFLPRTGDWAVELTAAPACDPCSGSWEDGGWAGFDPAAVADGGRVEIVADDDGVARPVIDIGSGEVTGRVVRLVDGELQGASGARVDISRRRRPEVRGDADLATFWSARASSDGSFSVAGLPDGRFEARAEERTSDGVERAATAFEIVDQAPLDSIELRLAREEPVRVIVTAAGVPVRGGYVSVTSGTAVRGGSPFGGDQEYWLPSPVAVVDVVAWSDGYGAVALRRDVSDGLPVAVELDTLRGDLRLPRRLTGRLVAESGAVFDLSGFASDMGRAIVEDGDEMILRSLAPGRYLWCPTPAEACSPVHVAPGVLNEVRDN